MGIMYAYYACCISKSAPASSVCSSENKISLIGSGVTSIISFRIFDGEMFDKAGNVVNLDMFQILSNR